MNTIARTLVATVLAAPLVAASSAAADSVVRVHASNATTFEGFLPSLPADMPWLASGQGSRRKPVMPEAGSVQAWVHSPAPVKAGSAPPIRSRAPATSYAGM